MANLSGRWAVGTGVTRVFIQIIQGTCRDAEALRRQTEMWREEVGPKAQGWLGGTFGVTDDSRFIGVVRFESAEAAERNSARPEQSAWWAVTEKLFEGEVTFRNSDEVILYLDGGSDDTGFVQVIQGQVADPEGFRSFMDQPMDRLHDARPEIIGGTIALEPDGRFTETVAFVSEEAARVGENREMPVDLQQAWENQVAEMRDINYLNLRRPWFASRE